MDTSKIEILPELKQTMRRLTDEERRLLEESIQRDGITDPLKLWKWGEHYILLDGINRLEIARKEGIDFRAVFIGGLEDLSAAKLWVNRNQRARRNLTEKEVAYYRGQRYNETPTKQRTKEDNGQIAHKMDVSAGIAREEGIHERTVRRDAEFARDVDKIAAAVGDELAAKALISKDARVNRKDVHGLAGLARKHPDEVRAALEGEKPVNAVLGKKKKEKSVGPVRELPPEGVAMTQLEMQGRMWELGKRLICSRNGGTLEAAGKVLGQMAHAPGARSDLIFAAVAIAVWTYPEDAIAYIKKTYARLKELAADKSQRTSRSKASDERLLENHERFVREMTNEFRNGH